jgi:rhamnosyltransferase
VSQNKKFRICAIVVIYFPEPDLLRQVINASLRQVDELVVVNNTPPTTTLNNVPIPESERITVLNQNKNIGLAAGLNVGIEFARRKKVTHYLLLDQDSLPASDMVFQLTLAWEEAANDALKVAAVGPAFTDDRGGAPPPFIKIGFPSNHVIQPTLGENYVRTHVLITSGCLISEAALDYAGLMNEWLFIDNVDIEWGFRVQSLGLNLIGAPHAKLAHRIGDEHLQAPRWARWLFRRQIAVRHNDFRLYYIFRNRIALYKLKTVPSLWKLQDLLRLPFKIALCVSISDQPLTTLRQLFVGMRDGLTSKNAFQASALATQISQANKSADKFAD